MDFTDDPRLIVSGFAFLEFAPLECFSQKCIEDLEIGSSIDDYFFSSTFFFGKISFGKITNLYRKVDTNSKGLSFTKFE